LHNRVSVWLRTRLRIMGACLLTRGSSSSAERQLWRGDAIEREALPEIG
jgi:hypothetical protein